MEATDVIEKLSKFVELWETDVIIRNNVIVITLCKISWKRNELEGMMKALGASNYSITIDMEMEEVIVSFKLNDS